ncbi:MULTISPECIES: hypothetical protein [unclassified Moorena]|nr:MULTISPECIES: hypothetical protein [unclassified Moorena]
MPIPPRCLFHQDAHSTHRVKLKHYRRNMKEIKITIVFRFDM